MPETPLSGLLTFLFTDLEDSTHLWEQFPVEMRPALARQDELLQGIVAEHNGRLVKKTGDGVHAVFESAADGVAAALAGQLAISNEAWPKATGPLRVRMGLHTGESQYRDGDYYGTEVNRAARVSGLAYGEQLLLSEATAALVRNSLPANSTLTDLGEHRLKGLAAPEKIYQLSHPEIRTEFPELRSLAAFKHNLPVRLSSFIGRERELAEVAQLLTSTRLLTLLGPGGTGKTRLSLQVAADLIEDFPDGVWFIELAPLADPDLLPDQIANTLNVQSQPGRAIQDALVDYLRPKALLLLLDNVEHLVRESASLVEHLLRNCPRIKVLVTGREALFIGGETTLQIPSLALPGPEEEGDLDKFAACEAVHLFLERVRAVQPHFELNGGVSTSIGEIVRRLDGIPLALELAAARLRMMSVTQVADRLHDRFRLLTGGRRTALPRQQTLQAMIDWSWNLLEEDERLLLRRLSVFSGGWTLEAAEAVAGFDGIDVFWALEQLVNKSLVVVDRLEGDEVRYRFLESIRQYARDKLFEAGEGENLRDRHADYFVAFTQEAEPHLDGREMMSWVGRLRREMDNLRSVMTWTLEERPELALRLTGVLFPQQAFWISPREAYSWLGEVTEHTRPILEGADSKISKNEYIKVLIALGYIFNTQGEKANARAVFKEAISLARRFEENRLLAHAIAGNMFGVIFRITPALVAAGEEAVQISRDGNFPIELARNLTMMGGHYFIAGEIEKGERYIAEAMEIQKGIGNPRELALTLESRWGLQFITGDHLGGKEFILSAIEKFEELGSQSGIDRNRSRLAHILRHEGKIEEGEALYCETIQAWQEQGAPTAVAHQLECFAFLAIAQDEHQRAARLIGAARAARERLNSRSDAPWEIAELDEALGTLSAAMGETARDQAIAEGAEMSLDGAVSYVVGMEK